jgi:AcrR family transcriptional regulator
MSTAAAPETPPRGTRPSNRREITVQTAVDLFARRGYAAVSMSDIASATNVGASALYRHFPGKSALLVAAIRSGLDPWSEAIGGPGGSDPESHLRTVLERLAGTAIDHRRVGVLWQREARNLPAADQRALRDALRTTANRLADAVLAARPELTPPHADLLAWCALGVAVSIGFHGLDLPRPQFEELLVDAMSRVIATPLPEDDDPPAARVREHHPPDTRRDQLITVATQLFADRGFAATGIDEIGIAAGIAGPSVYNHFVSKRAILAAAIDRAAAILRDELAAVLASSDAAPQKLAALVESYVHRAETDRFVIRTLISEMDQLEPDDREQARLAQRRYIDAWVDLLLRFSDTDPVAARIRVQAALLMVNDAVQTHHLRRRAGFERALSRITANVLGAPIA